MKKQVHVFYSGRVQGVGFRFTARNIADELGVCGWAKNLADGRVQVVGEAEKGLLNDFLDRINKSFSRYIRDIEVQWQDTLGELKGFTIKF